jgi:hypothetical protein
MQTPRRRTTRIVGWTAVGVVGLAVAAGAAQASTTGSASTNSGLAAVATAAVADPATPASPAPSTQARGPLRGRGLHGEFTVEAKGGSYQVVDVQRGAIKSTANGSVTVASVDGFQATYLVTAETKVRRGKATIAAGDLEVDDQVVVAAVKGADGTLTARALGVPDPNAKPKPGHAKKGKSSPTAPTSPSPAPASPDAQPGMFSTGSA